MSIEIRPNVKKAEADAQAGIYRDAGAREVTQAPEPDGEVTLIIVWDDAAAPPLTAADIKRPAPH